MIVLSFMPINKHDLPLTMKLCLLLTHKLIVGNTLNSVILTTRGQLVPFINIIVCA